MIKIQFPLYTLNTICRKENNDNLKLLLQSEYRSDQTVSSAIFKKRKCLVILRSISTHRKFCILLLLLLLLLLKIKPVFLSVQHLKEHKNIRSSSLLKQVRSIRISLEEDKMDLEVCVTLELDSNRNIDHD